MAESNLLTPSLTEAPRTPIFSVNALIAAAFFGGVFAVPLLGMENSRRLSRLRADWPLLLLGLLLAAGTLLFILQSLDMSEFSSEFRLVNRGLGFAYVAGCYWLHRQAFRSLKMVGIKPAPAWPAVLASVVLGLAISLALRNSAVLNFLQELL